MKVIGFNGSPRKNWNTAILLNKALEGSASLGAETELIHLYDIDYKGCTSCFACKRKLLYFYFRWVFLRFYDLPFHMHFVYTGYFAYGHFHIPALGDSCHIPIGQ